MRFNIQPFAAVISADIPVLGRIIVHFGRFRSTVSSDRAIVCFPFVTIGADSVSTSVTGGGLGAAVLTLLTVGADFYTVFAGVAFTANSNTVGADSLAARTYLRSAVSAIAAFLAQ